MDKQEDFKESPLGKFLAIMLLIFIAIGTGFALFGCVPAEAPHDQEAMHISNLFPGFVVGAVVGMILIFFVLNKFVQREKRKSNAQAICDALNSCYYNGLNIDLELVNNTLTDYTIQFERIDQKFMVMEVHQYSGLKFTPNGIRAIVLAIILSLALSACGAKWPTCPTYGSVTLRK